MMQIPQESDVGNALGYIYPQQVDEQVSTYLETIREMPSSQSQEGP